MFQHACKRVQEQSSKSYVEQFVAEAADLLAKVAAELAYDIHHTAFANCVEAPE
jgi:hypothetical protein